MNSPVVIEAAINGVVRKSDNPHVPRQRDEIRADIRAVIAAGASMVHPHQSDEGRGPTDTDDYAATWQPVIDDEPALAALSDGRSGRARSKNDGVTWASSRSEVCCASARSMPGRPTSACSASTACRCRATTCTRTATRTSRTWWASASTIDWRRPSRSSSRPSCTPCSRTTTPDDCRVARG